MSVPSGGIARFLVEITGLDDRVLNVSHILRVMYVCSGELGKEADVSLCKEHISLYHDILY